ncbi:MAG TPA: antibiotic biosynthesis monooxygenase [Solirubrobacteraceae bacterium]|nr:antibiotic biosynthesis monooxygenase [Solirubrobacteraceae bacterium]
MILERAIFAVRPGTEPDFEAAMEQAKDVIAQAGGFRSFRLQRGIEQPSTYLLLVEWDTLEDHVQGFRASELFVRWRELIDPHFAAPPEVEHYTSTLVSR